MQQGSQLKFMFVSAERERACAEAYCAHVCDLTVKCLGVQHARATTVDFILVVCLYWFVFVSLCSPGQPGTQYHGSQAGFELTSPAISDMSHQPWFYYNL